MRKFRFYKEGTKWYVDLPEWKGAKADLEMVAGADTMLEYMAEGGGEVTTYISEKEFENADELILKGPAQDIGSGAYYTMRTFRGIEITLDMWLCDVTLFVFNGKFPNKIFIAVCQ